MAFDVLTQTEVEQVILAALQAAAVQGRPSLTRAELKRAVAWARGARVRATLLAEVLAGRVGAYPGDGGMTFGVLPTPDAAAQQQGTR